MFGSLDADAIEAFMFHIHPHVAITEYALKRCPNIYGKGKSILYVDSRVMAKKYVLDAPVDMWDNIQGGFFDHLEQIDADLKAAGLPVLGLSSPSKVEDAKERHGESLDAFTNGTDFVVANSHK